MKHEKPHNVLLYYRIPYPANSGSVSAHFTWFCIRSFRLILYLLILSVQLRRLILVQKILAQKKNLLCKPDSIGHR